jgi:hypothetical protein
VADPEGSLEYFGSGATEETEIDPLQPGPKVVVAKVGDGRRCCLILARSIGVRHLIPRCARAAADGCGGGGG